MYRGVQYSFDLGKRVPLEDGQFMIIAIDQDPNDEIIAHFVGIRREGNMFFYYNSYGHPMVPYDVLLYSTRCGCRTIVQNEKQHQGILKPSNRCGYYTMYVLDELMEKEYADVMATLQNDEDANKSVISEHFNKKKYSGV